MLPDPTAEIILLGPLPLLDGGLPILEDVIEEPLAYKQIQIGFLGHVSDYIT